MAVLIGGNSRSHQLPPQAAAALGIRLAAMSKTSGAGLLVTTSRRTGTESAAILRETLQDCPAWFWDGQGGILYGIPGRGGYGDRDRR